MSTDDRRDPTGTTDYDFPDGWGLFSDEQKSAFYVDVRVRRQAMRQDTAVGRRYRREKDAQPTDEYRYDP